ncbi:MAG TPA: 30S ribosomal protein S6 [Clostridiales bacterium]|nr:30S ribosomal protein S6 [Clostridiales bacterium]
MNKYETIFVINPELDEEATKAVVEKFKNLIVQEGGQVDNIDEWGKRKLAYKVKDFKEGYYVLMNFAAAPTVPQELERVYRITGDIIRYLIVKQKD